MSVSISWHNSSDYSLDYSKSSDTEFLEAIQDQDQQAFRALLERHQGKIDGIIHKVLGHRKDHFHDAQQEVHLALFQSLSGFQNQAGFSTYLYRVVRNRSIDYLRQVLKDQGPSRSVRSLNDIEHQLPDQTNSPQKALEKKIDLERLQKALLDEPELDQKILELREVQGWPMAAIAQKLGLKENALRTRLHRLRRRLFLKLKGKMGMKGEKMTNALEELQICRECQDALQDAHDYGTDLGDELLGHLNSCPDCQEFQAFLGELTPALQELSRFSPKGPSEPKPRRSWVHKLVFSGILSAAAAVILIFSLPSQSPVDPAAALEKNAGTERFVSRLLDDPILFDQKTQRSKDVARFLLFSEQRRD